MAEDTAGNGPVQLQGLLETVFLPQGIGLGKEFLSPAVIGGGTKVKVVPDEAFADLDRPHRILVAVKDPENLYHLEEVLSKADADETDVIVLYCKPVENVLYRQDMRSAAMDEQEVFTAVIFMAEKYGLPVTPVLVHSNDAYYAIAQAAAVADAEEVVMGVSGRHGANPQIERAVMTWGAVKDHEIKHPVTLRILWEGREVSYRFTR